MRVNIFTLCKWLTQLSFASLTDSSWVVGLVVSILGQSNDNCDSSIQIDAFPYSSSADTSLASSDFASTVCQVNSNDKGLWYSLVGTGQAMTISITSSAMDSQIALFSGNDCNQLFCLDYNSNTGYRRNDSSLTFLTEVGGTYRFHVSGRSESAGTFSVNVVVRVSNRSTSLSKSYLTFVF